MIHHNHNHHTIYYAMYTYLHMVQFQVMCSCGFFIFLIPYRDMKKRESSVGIVNPPLICIAYLIAGNCWTGNFCETDQCISFCIH